MNQNNLNSNAMQGLFNIQNYSSYIILTLDNHSKTDNYTLGYGNNNFFIRFDFKMTSLEKCVLYSICTRNQAIFWRGIPEYPFVREEGILFMGITWRKFYTIYLFFLVMIYPKYVDRRSVRIVKFRFVWNVVSRTIYNEGDGYTFIIMLSLLWHFTFQFNI